MKVKMLKTAASPELILLEGKTYDLNIEFAKCLIAAKACESSDEKPIPVIDTSKIVGRKLAETASVNPAENKKGEQDLKNKNNKNNKSKK